MLSDIDVTINLALDRLEGVSAWSTFTVPYVGGERG